jgi:LysM repeat protein
MDLDGHYLITKTAMEETRGKVSFFPAAADIAAVYRDLQDLTGAHDSDEGQRHHFMAVKGQSQEDAYLAALGWIRTYATEAARMYIGGFGESVSEALCREGMRSPPGSVFGGVISTGATGSAVVKGQKTVPWAVPGRSPEYGTMMCTGARPLGTAAHAVEDSFAPMHVMRDGGKIVKIMVYADQDHHQHDEEDRKWEGKSGSFSGVGRAAVEAVKDLFMLVDAAVRSKQANLAGWDTYVQKWFQPGFKGQNTPLQGVIPPTAPVVTKPSQLATIGPRHHTVKSGESLSIIAGQYYGDVLLWPVIYDANRNSVKDPNMIQRGWVLSIPEASAISDGEKPALRERGRHWRSGPW